MIKLIVAIFLTIFYEIGTIKVSPVFILGVLFFSWVTYEEFKEVFDKK